MQVDRAEEFVQARTASHRNSAVGYFRNTQSDDKEMYLATVSSVARHLVEIMPLQRL
jgi:hypothetical protein